jgi:hypothetical protein
MKVTTSDGKTIDDFQNLQDVVREVQQTQAIQSVPKSGARGSVTYKNNSIKVGSTAQLGAEIPNLLKDMKLCHWQGEIFSGGTKIFLEDFARSLIFLFTWICSIKQRKTPVNVTTSQMKDALEWLVLAVKCVRVGDMATVLAAIDQLEAHNEE